MFIMYMSHMTLQFSDSACTTANGGADSTDECYLVPEGTSSLSFEIQLLSSG